MGKTTSPSPPGDTLVRNNRHGQLRVSALVTTKSKILPRITHQWAFQIKGFTLMEILIAVVIFGVLMTTLFTAFNSFISSTTAVSRTLTEDERVRTLLDILEMDLNALYITRPPRYVRPETTSDGDLFSFNGVQEEISGISISRLGFASLNHLTFGPMNHPGVAKIIYYARTNEENENEIDLCRSDLLRPFDDPGESPCDPVLIRNIQGFELSYVDAEGDEQTDWDSESSTFGYTVPLSIKLKITLKTQGSPKIVQTEIPLVVSRQPLE
ncbi:GspJ1 [Desulforapulum autotrophicum HRM2]|uniref:GspJ1 n=1 Tax=Desulforapulum autotrophicum (strain ATCC 43914 / DSM 3382 / VKM B-1955 / HRM2) TaxID=177437 RepID=C0QLU3_DESAH|nr:prepilin-type N-terminal cleavage/methylation domain-containing protein [Desulforapulum autotrophicum]ACN14249.1 GspJ1 [Desulforapulum autotrophicum HRM2]